jgi:hypothetical protein
MFDQEFYDDNKLYIQENWSIGIRTVFKQSSSKAQTRKQEDVFKEANQDTT